MNGEDESEASGSDEGWPFSGGYDPTSAWSLAMFALMILSCASDELSFSPSLAACASATVARSLASRAALSAFSSFAR